MLVVDSQVHVWGPKTPEYPTMVGNVHRIVPMSPDLLIREMDVAGVNRTVMIPPIWQGVRNDIALDGAGRYPQRLAAMGRLDLTAKDASERVATWRNQSGMMGIRLDIKQDLTADGSMNDVLSAAQAHGVRFMLNRYPHQLKTVAGVAEAYPELKITIDHAAVLKGKKDEAAFAELDSLLALAKYQNMAVKVSGFANYTTDCYPYRRLHPQLRRLYDAFGPRRMFWGSNFTKMPCTYRDCVTMFTEVEIPWLSKEDKEWIMGRAVCEWLGWG